MAVYDAWKLPPMVRWAVVGVGLLAVLLAFLLYRPLPEGMLTSLDRVLMIVAEPFVRVAFFYPVRFCPAYFGLYWMRTAMMPLNYLMPLLFYDSVLHMETTHWDGVRVRVYHPRNNETESDGAIIFMHGGGFVIGTTEAYEPLTRRMAKEMSVRLFVSIDYRLAPETIFPGALEDCEKVLEYVIKSGPSKYGIDPRKIVLMGDSAGGTLAAVIPQRRKERQAEPKILGQVLVYPLLHMSDMQSYSFRMIKRKLDGMAFVDAMSSAMYPMWSAGIDVNAHPEYVRAAVTNGHVNEEAKKLRDELLDYSVLPAEFRDDANGTDLRVEVEPNEELMAQIGPLLINPDFAPLMRRDLTNLPPALVLTCEYDLLRDEGAIYAHRLKKAGVPTRWSHYKHGFHGFFHFPDYLRISKDAVAEVEEWAMKLLREAAV